MAFENLGGLLPEQTLATAVAMAERSAIAQAVGDRISAEIQGEPQPEIPIEVRRASHLGQCTLMLLQLENPGRTLSIQELLEASNGDQGYTHRAEIAADRYGVAVDAEKVRELDRTLFKELSQSGSLSDEKMTDDFARHLEASKRVAAAHNVELAAVYVNDDLFYEASREATPPEEAADNLVGFLEMLSTETVNKVTLQALDSLLPEHEWNDVTQEERAEMALAIQLNPQVQSAIEASAQLVQEAARQTLLYFFIKTYGRDAINALPSAQKERMQPTLPLASDLAGLMSDPEE